MQTALIVTLTAGLGLGQTANLDFSHGTLKGWEGGGFYITAGNPRGPGPACGACSSDAGSPDRRGMIRFVFMVPAGVSQLTFQAFASTPLRIEPDHRLDVVLAGEDKVPVPRQVRTSSGTWTPAPRILSRWQGKPRDYAWDVSHLQGHRVQVVLLDQDDRPGCHLYATGFRFLKATAFQDEEFFRYMVELEGKHGLAPVSRYDSKRFTAISNASEKFSMQSVRFCEVMYDLFYHHFQKKGFRLRHPGQTLMLAVFDGPDGFDAYLKTKMPAGVTGIYHQGTNRLVIYDLRENRALVKGRDEALKKAKWGRKIDKDKGKVVDSVYKHFDEIAKDLNVSTTMHEAAHQLSFNCGLLNRDGDVAAWLAEGLACYCEATDSGDWQAIGSFNPARVNDLRQPVAGRRPWIPLSKLIEADGWLDGGQVLQGYAQSWALFHMLMHEQTPALRNYLSAVYPRQAPEYRLEDFRNAFGEIEAFEKRYVAYMKKLVESRSER